MQRPMNDGIAACFGSLLCQGEGFFFGTVNQKAARVDAAQSHLAQLTI